jgi:ATP-dependent protease ClpP protease subunit
MYIDLGLAVACSAIVSFYFLERKDNSLKNFDEELIMPLPNRIIDEMIVNSAIRDRKIHINDVIDKDSVFKALYWLDRIVSIDDKEDIEMACRKPIELIISSRGGFIEQGLALVSKIESLKKLGYTIITTISGYAYSMGAIISIVGSKRQAYKYSRIMFHTLSAGTIDDLEHMERDVEDMQIVWKRIKEIIVSNTKISSETLDYYKERRKDMFLWSDSDGLNMGCVDFII